MAETIDQAFVATFQVVMFICAGLAWLSAGMASWFIEEEETPMS